MRNLFEFEVLLLRQGRRGAFAGYPRPPLADAGASWVLTGTHQRAPDAQAVWHRSQSANPLWLGLSCSRVVLDMVIMVRCVVVENTF